MPKAGDYPIVVQVLTAFQNQWTKADWEGVLGAADVTVETLTQMRDLTSTGSSDDKAIKILERIPTYKVIQETYDRLDTVTRHCKGSIKASFAQNFKDGKEFTSFLDKMIGRKEEQMNQQAAPANSSDMQL